MKSKLLLLYFLFFNLSVFSQTNKEKNDILKETNVSELLKISNAKRKQSIEDKKLALSLAKANNWPIFIKDSTGGFSELMKVDSRGNPVYYTTYNYGAGLTARTNHLYSGGSLGLNIEGQNMIAGEWDGGAVLLTHELFEGRVTQMDGASSTHYHSTHVAGTIIGTDQVQGGNARGMAFKANLHAYEWNDDQAEVAQAAASGLLISNHSYGHNPAYLSLHQFGKYEEDANAFDDIMYNAPYYLFVAAAGNARDDGYNSSDNGYDLLSGHACSKNSMVVAAIHELTNYSGPSSVIMSYFSSWGPTDDGRIKPDISAKGVDTYSASDSSNSSYITISGTSMASPSVTGTLLLLQQYYQQLYGHFMHSSTLRGLALHTADEAGNNPGPDYEYGWGLINAKKAAEVIRDNGLVSYISEETLNQGATYSISFDALGSEPLKATICWTDPAGTIITNTIEDYYSPALVNDLDIRITKNGTTYYPWKLDPNNPSAAATQGDNVVDNIEQVFVDNPVGTYTITVTHKGTLQSGAQNFSIIVSGISFNDFYITSSDVNQSICQGEDTAQFNLDLSTISGFSDTVNFSTINLPAGVNASFSPASLNAAGNFTLDLSNLSGLTAGVYPFTIHGESSADTADLDVMLHVYDNAFPPQILNSPANNATAIPLDATLSWEENSNAQQYLIQIATDNTFTNIIESALVSSTGYQVTTLDNNTTYYWRVKPSNMCGDGSFSSTYSFTTVCIGPTNITTSNVTLDSVDVSWTENSGATNWEIEAVEAGSTPTGIGVPVNTNPYTLTGLNSSTEYTIYVRSGCGSGNFSNWGVSSSFVTASDYCNGEHFYDSGGPSGSYSNNEYSITTIAPSAGNNTITVTFNSFQLESGYDELKVYNGSDINAPLLGTFSGSSIPGPFTSDNPSGTLTFLFTSDVSVTYSGWDATVDCFFTSCPRPSNVTSQNTTDNSLDLSWIAGGSENEWEIEYGLTGFTQGSGTLVQTTSNPHTITGLNASTTYDFYVRAICGANPGDDDSLWVGPVSFTTLCGVTTAPFIDNLESFNGDYEIENCWSATPLVSSYNYAWNISSNGSTPSSNTGPSQANSGSTFFFTEASNGSTGNIAELITPIIDISSLTVPQLSFYYHMYGADMGTLHIDVYNNGNWTNDVIVLDGQQQTSGTSPWIEQTLVLSAFTGNVQIRFRGIKGNSYKSDMAIDDIKIIEAPTCPVPTNFAADNITATTVDLSWVNGNTETNWEIEYGNSGFTHGTGTTVAVTTNPFTLSGLTPQTDYDVYLKAICGTNPGDDDSLWVGPVSFTTLCGVTTAPFIDNLESFNGDYEIENCWSATPLVSSYNYAWNISSNGSTPSSNTGPSQANSGSTFFFTEASNGSTGNIAELITPIIDISSLTAPQLSFYYHMYGADMGTLHVDVYNNGNWTNDVVVLNGQQQMSDTSPWIEQTFVLNAFTGNVQIRFRGEKGSGYRSDMAIDDIKIIEAPTCPVPTNFTADNITATTVDLSWVNGNSETNWEIEYGNSGFTQGTGTTIAVTTNPFTLSGLTPQTNYDVYLKAICGANPGDDDSLWVGPVSFTTHALASPHNLTADLDTTTGVVTLNWNQTAGFYEDFTDGIADNWVPVTGNWSVSNNTYNVTRTTHDVSSSYYDQDFSNFEFEMKAKKNTGDAYNISMFFNGDPSNIDSYGNWNNTYCLMYSTNGEWKLVKIINGNWTNIADWTTSSAINTGYNWNIVKVEYVNGYINAYMNNVLLGSYYDTTFPSGKIGIKIYDSNSNATNLGSFDYISLTDLSNTTNNYTFNVVEPNSFRNITSSGNCNNNEACSYSAIIGTETTPIPRYGKNYTYTSNIPNAFLNYKIYRDGVEIGTSIPETYTDQLPAYGDYQYYVTSIYDIGESSPSNTVNVSWHGTPDIVVNPLTLSQTLYPNENATQPVTITNNGDDDLNFTINSTVVSTNSENIGYDNIETNNLNPYYVENSLDDIMITPTYSKRTYYNTMDNLNILIYEQTNDKNYYTDALIDLGYTFTQVSSWNELENTISNGTNWDLVIVNSYDGQCNSNVLTALDLYQSNGGFLIFSDWKVEDYASHSLFSNFGISFLSSISTPINFSATDTNHPIFNIPNQINTFTWSDDQYYIDGQLVNLINGSIQLAAFSGYPTNGAIVLNANQNCLFNAFQSDNFQHDDNNNGKDDMIELIENEIEYLIGRNYWLSTTQTSGTVAAGSSVTIDVNFDSTDMAVGTYNGTVAISSNDPDQPVVNVAAELIVIDNGGDVNELSQFDFKYYPNPFNKSINISANKDFDSVTVFSLIGQELINIKPINKSQLTIDMSKFSVGTYYLKVVIDGKTASMKIIKKKL